MRKEFVPPEQTVNGNFYCDVLRLLRENFRRKSPVKWRNNSWVLRHDNAPAHTSFVVPQILSSSKTTVTPHPPYSSDLALCNFFLFPKMKLKHRERCFESTEMIKAESREVLKMLTQSDFQQCCGHGNPAGFAVLLPSTRRRSSADEFRELLGATSYVVADMLLI
jgi:hypothetical protein